jgi:hypothetical protein
MKHVIFTRLALAAIYLIGFSKVYAQCTITGLNANYCTNSAASTLTPGIPGGIFSGPGIAGSVFNPGVAGPGTHTINYNVCATSYSVASIPFAPTTTAGNPVVLADDATTGALAIGFNFVYYCNTYTQFYICSNGFITFNGGQASPWVPSAFPNATTPFNAIAPSWTDLNPSLGGNITYTTIGAAPNRSLVVSYNAVSHHNGGNGGDPVTLQIILYETTNLIDFQTTTKPIPNGGSLAIMAIQNAAANTATWVTNRNPPASWAANNEGQRFTPGASCAISQTTTVSPSTISVTGNNTVCAGSTATLTATGNTTYTWSTNSNNASINVAPPTNTSYTVSGTNSFGCVATGTIAVTVDNTPTVSAVPASTTVCAGKTVVLNGSGATSYTWSGAVAVTNGVAFTPPATGNYIVTGGNTCGTATAVTNVVVNPLPNIGGSANNPTVCFGSQVILNGTGSVNGYNWTGGVNDNQAFTPPVGINSYTVTGGGANTCTNTAVVTVTVLQTPTLTPVVTPTAICVGKTATLSASGAVNGYTWSTNPAVFTSTAAVSPVITSTYSVMRATGACTSIATVTVVVNPLPNLLVGAPNPPTICAGTCATVTGQGAITYTWFPGGFQGGVLTVCPNSSTNYTVVASNANCTTSATSSVTVLPNPVLSIQVTTTTPCEGSEITMTVTGASSYTWNSPISVPQQNQSVVTHSPSVPIQYTVTGIDANGCTSTMNQVILPQAAPNLTTSIVNTGSFICAGQIGTLVAQGTGQVNYNWLPNGSSVGTTTVNPPVSTVYTVTAINPGTGCMSTATLSLAVYISTFVVSSPGAICKGNTATLSVAGAANSYTWNAGTPNNNDSIFVTPQSNITYYVTGITGNCSTTQSINLVVNPIPPVTAVAQKITICRFEPGILLGSGAGANGTYSWTGGPGAATQNFTVFPTITTTYTLTGTDVNGCSKKVTVTQLVATCIGIEEQNPLAGLLSIYPNPSKGEFTIQAAAPMNISIVNELGQLVRSFPIQESESAVHVTDLANGIYFILVEKDGNVMTSKMIIEK